MVGAAGAPVVVEDGLADAARRYRDLLAMLNISDLALAQGLLHRRLDLDAGAPEETLAVAEALALRIGSAINNVHRTPSGRLVANI